MAALRQQYGCGPVELTGNTDALYERHLLFDNVIDPTASSARDRYEAFARSVRDVLSQRWVRTEQTYERLDPKRVYYLSMEFLIGRSLANNITNLMLSPLADDVVKRTSLDWLGLLEEEPDAGLGNGGLGRLAACFLDSMATMQLPAIGYGLRYEYGMFRQSIEDGWQHEQPDNWLRRPDPWEVVRPDDKVEVRLNSSIELRNGASTSTSVNSSTHCGSSCSTTGCARTRASRWRRGRSSSRARRRRPTIWPRSSSSSSTTSPPPSTATRRSRGRLKVVFLPEYNVSLAERLIPASDVSNQISTAGYEASGTSNMKFMMNGALTIGTRDGATIEMAEEAGEENFFLFGLTAEQVAGSRGWYNPHWHYDHEPETRAALDLIFSDHFSRNEPGIFAPLRDTLLTHGDHYMHLADLTSYLEADRRLRRAVRGSRGVGAQGHPERGQLREILERPHDRRVRGRTSGTSSHARCRDEPVSHD